VERQGVVQGLQKIDQKDVLTLEKII
jgi:hypothetical protein